MSIYFKRSTIRLCYPFLPCNSHCIDAYKRSWLLFNQWKVLTSRFPSLSVRHRLVSVLPRRRMQGPDCRSQSTCKSGWCSAEIIDIRPLISRSRSYQIVPFWSTTSVHHTCLIILRVSALLYGDSKLVHHTTLVLKPLFQLFWHFSKYFLWSNFRVAARNRGNGAEPWRGINGGDQR